MHAKCLLKCQWIHKHSDFTLNIFIYRITAAIAAAHGTQIQVLSACLLIRNLVSQAALLWAHGSVFLMTLQVLERSFIWGIKVLLVEQNLVDENACCQINLFESLR